MSVQSKRVIEALLMLEAEGRASLLKPGILDWAWVLRRLRLYHREARGIEAGVMACLPSKEKIKKAAHSEKEVSGAAKRQCSSPVRRQSWAEKAQWVEVVGSMTTCDLGALGPPRALTEPLTEVDSGLPA
ncbi:hypothetical protein NDU88_002256 [Pleurodeles waltl]|uniref:Uncharacterized protein n=1 Tax=Pleurodeles waltl TaxID=8319 RepID=A0AAV7VCW1_PLEWA|nr:hypothetical protein NDU88_002256 [Pleurodeles waltl]